MFSFLTGSLWLLLLLSVCCLLVSGDPPNIKAEPGQTIILPCRDADGGNIIFIEWTRTDLKSGYVIRYRNGQIDPDGQSPLFKDRVDLNDCQLKDGDVSLVLKNAMTNDSGTYECRVTQKDRPEKLISSTILLIAPPELFPSWATALFVILALVVVAAGLLYHYRHYFMSVYKLEVESGMESVLLPCEILPWKVRGADRVEWMDDVDRKVHVYQKGSDEPREQDQRYRERTRMNKKTLRTGDLSLTLMGPTYGDGGIYTCSVSSSKGDILMKKQVLLEVKVQQQVETESGAKSVLLPCRTAVQLPEDARVEWRDGNRKVHVFQNGSDQPGKQDLDYRTRTSMDGDPLRTGDATLTLRWPTEYDSSIYTCIVFSREGHILMKNQVLLKVKVHQVEAESGAESVLLPWEPRVEVPVDAARVEWMDEEYNVVHVSLKGSDQPGKQDRRYKTRTSMNKNPLTAKDLSLALMKPTSGDSGRYTCRVSSSTGVMLMEKQVRLQVKVPQVEVKEGVESVELPFRTTLNLPKKARVEWMDSKDRRVHVYQKGSDQPGEQSRLYRTRTSMDKNPLKTGDLSLTLKWPREKDSGVYKCVVWKNGKHLRRETVQLTVKVESILGISPFSPKTVQVPSDVTRNSSSSSGIDSPLMADQSV